MNALPKREKWMCVRAPRVGVIRPGVRPGLDRDEAVPAVVVRQAATTPAEVWIERCVVRVDPMPVPSRRVRLPDLEQLAAERATVGAEHPTADDDPLTEGLAGVLSREVVVELAERSVAERRARQLRQGVRDDHERLLRRPQPRSEVVGIVERRIDIRSVAVQHPCEPDGFLFHRQASTAVANDASVTASTSAAVPSPRSSVSVSAPS